MHLWLTATSSRLLWWSLTDRPLSCCCSCPTPWLLRSREGMNQSWSSSSSISWKQRSKNSCSSSSSSTWEDDRGREGKKRSVSKDCEGKGDERSWYWRHQVSARTHTHTHLSVVLLLILHPHVLSERVGIIALSCVAIGHWLFSFLARSSSSRCLGHLWTAHLSWLCRHKKYKSEKTEGVKAGTLKLLVNLAPKSFAVNYPLTIRDNWLVKTAPTPCMIHSSILGCNSWVSLFCSTAIGYQRQHFSPGSKFNDISFRYSWKTSPPGAENTHPTPRVSYLMIKIWGALRNATAESDHVLQN